MRWDRVLMVLVLAALCFGGTFTCKEHNGNHTSTVVTN
jgi:hypothetical protein